MRGRIHRGSREIGGSCIELESDDGSRLLLDLGRPLSAGWDDDVELPAVSGLDKTDPSLLGIVISHPHLDHYGLLAQVASPVPIFIGREAAAILSAASFFSPISGQLHPTGFLRDGEAFALGPFRITPFLNDHSAFDAYSLFVEADGRRLFYTGDFRGHGRKAALFEQFLADPPADVNVLVMEGTHVRPGGVDDDVEYETESDLEDRFVDLAERTAGAVVVLGSAQNLDRLVTVYRATVRAGRFLVVDLYGATVAQATRATIPQPGFDRLRIYVPNRQRVRIKQTGEFERVSAIRPHRLFPEMLAATPEHFVFLVPSSTVRELLEADVLTSDGVAVWSLWDGYLKGASGQKLTHLLADRDISLLSVHTSGHASVADLRRLVVAIQPERLVPIHSEATARFSELFPDVERHVDGEWWTV